MNDNVLTDNCARMVDNAHTVETRSSCRPHEENVCEKRLLSIAIISPMRKSQKNKLQKLSVCRNEFGVLEIE